MQPATRIPALVLAGGKTSPAFAAEAGVANRALAEIDGLPMVRYVLRALKAAESIDRVLLVAPEGFPPEPEADLFVPADAGLEQNIRTALRHCGDAEFALLVTADLPFLTPLAVDEYVRRGLESGADLCYAGIPRESCRERFPAMKRTYLRTPGLTVTGGNVVLQRISAFEPEAEVLRQAYASRKSPVGLAKLIGLGNVLKLLVGRLKLEDIEREVSRLMTVRCRIIVTAHAELGTDIDRPADLRLARELLRNPSPER